MKRVTLQTLGQVGIAVLLVMEIASGGGIVPSAPPALAKSGLDAARQTWEGGGPALLFVDDLSNQTAARYDAMDPYGAGAPFGYYGAAVPAPDGSVERQWQAARWRHEPLRWGQEGAQRVEGWLPATAWERTALFGDGAWHFGSGAPADSSYPTGALAGVVSPVVDLRSVPVLPGAQSASVLDPTGTTPFVGGTREKPVSAGGATVAPADDIVRQGGETVGAATPVAGATATAAGVGATVDPTSAEATAALRLLHAYQFRVGDDGSLVDGGRVEVSQLDPVSGWSAWAGLTPASNTLRLDGRGVQASRSVPAAHQSVDASAGPGGPGDTLPLVVDLKGQTPPAGVDSTTSPPVDVGAGNRMPVEAGTGGDLTAPVKQGPAVAQPWLYQGQVGSDGANNNDPLNGPWEGFGASSQGPVESVFDLTPYAGHLVRFRFLASTTRLEGAPTTPGLGWVLDQLEVHAVSAEAVGILDLALPGDGSILPPGKSFAPTVVLQNHGLTPVKVAVSLAMDGAIPAVQDLILGVGASGRGVEAFPAAGAPAPGLHVLHVGVASTPLPRQPGLPSPVDLDKMEVASAPIPGGSALFHFEVGTGVAWHAVGLRTRQFGPGVDEESRVVTRSQQLHIYADLENLGAAPLDLSLTTAVRPIVRDIHGKTVGTITPLNGTASVLLPPSRETAGPLGTPDAVRTVGWLWTGSPLAQPVDLTLERLGQGPAAIELDGGRIRVESIEPPPLAVDFNNPWQYPGGCDRSPQLAGHVGVLHCTPGGHARSPVQPITALQLRRGGQTTLAVTHQGEAGTLLLYRLAGDPATAGLPPHDDSRWPQTAAFSIPLPAAADWVNERLPFFKFEDGADTPWSGWFYVEVATPTGNASIDDLRLEAGPDGHGVPILDETLNADLQPEANRIASPAGRPMARLTGIAAMGKDVLPNNGVERPGAAPTYVRVEDGVVSAKVVGRQDVAPISTNDKVHLDTNLSLPGTYLLQGARPSLRFSHWIGADGAVGLVEVAPAQTGNWTAVAAFTGREGWSDLQAVTVPLWAYVGQEVAVRFRYHLQPGMLSPFQAPLGWIVDSVQLDVQGTEGTRILHTGDGFARYTLPVGVDLGTEFGGAPRAQPVVRGPADQFPGLEVPPSYWGFDRRGMFFDNALCASAQQRSTYAISQSAITDPVDLRGMDKSSRPELVIEQGGLMRNQRDPAHPSDRSVAAGTKVLDVEFQTLGPGGWSDWRRATPHKLWVRQPYTLGSDDVGMWDGNATAAVHLTDPQGRFVSQPFAAANWGKLEWNEGATLYKYTREDATTRFDLSAEADAARPGGKITRFRFHVWTEGHDTTQGCPPAFEWSVYSMRIQEQRQLADAGIDGIMVSPDDRALLGRLDPGFATQNPRAAAIAGDTVTVSVAVRNSGRLALRVNTTLTLNTPSPVITYIDTSAGLPIPRRGQRHGILDLEAGQSTTVKFLVEFNKLPPGSYALSAAVAPEDAVDTNPRNDLAVKPVVVRPFRALAADPATARVEPAVGTPDAVRIARLQLLNQGNVPEAAVKVTADIVRYTGVSTVVPLGVVLPSAQPFPLDARGRSPKQLGWTLDPASLGPGKAFEVGERYAIRVTVETQADSFKPWWDGAPTPFGPCAAGGEAPCLADLTALGSCHCVLLPFRAEGLLFRDTLGVPNVPATPATQSALPDTFPALGTPQEWEATTLVEKDGRMVDAAARTDLPKWQVVDGATAARVGGGPTAGKGWYLPPYPGLETLQHTLVSPVIPAQAVGPASRALLNLRYASNLTEGQAVLQQRTLQGGQWTAWQPIDALRNSRAALVLAPDFPRVTGAPFAATGGYPSNNEPLTAGRPIPPYYTSFTGIDGSDDTPNDGKDHPVACNWGGTPTGRCLWSPFPDFPAAGDPEWVAALATSLCALGDALGPQNVELFGTLSLLRLPAGTAPSQAQPVVRAADSLLVSCAGSPVPAAFPLRELDNLGVHLSDFGAVLLVGDGATTTFSGLSERLRAMSIPAPAGTPAPAGQYASLAQTPISRPADAVTLNHFEKLFDILKGAPDAGVRVVGSIGPASGTVALSGLARHAQLTTWTTPGMPPMDLPDPWMPWVDPVGFPTNGEWKCLVWGDPNGRDNYTAVGVNLQPKAPCFDTVSGKETPPPGGYRWNYQYVSAQDAQSMALQDFLANGEASFDASVGRGLIGSTYLGVGAGVCAYHQKNGYLRPLPPACVVPTPVVASPTDDPRLTLVSAARETDATAWVAKVVERMHGSGALPDGTHRWQVLDPGLGSPVGGHFVRSATGANVFQGAPMQVRLVVRSTPQAGGHGSFLVGPLEVLGTAQGTDVGIAFAQPEDGHAYQPGEAGFYPVLELSNRGTHDVPLSSLAARVAAAQTGNCDGACAVQVPDPVTLGGLPGMLRAGESLYVTLGNGPPLDQMLGAAAIHLPSLRYATRGEDLFGGTFPGKDLPAGQSSRFTFSAQLQGAGAPYQDDQPLDDRQTIQVVGGQIVNPVVKAPTDLSWSPTEAARSTTDRLTLHARLTNDGSLKQLKVRIEAEISDARPQHCYREGPDGRPGAFWPCDATQAGHPPLGAPMHAVPLGTSLVPRGATVERDLPLDLDALHLPAGVYSIRVVVDVLDPSTGPPLQHQAFLSMVHLADPAIAWDQGYARQAGDLSHVGSTATLGNGAGDFFVDSASMCQQDPNARDLEHGWRLADDAAGACSGTFPTGEHALEWRRTFQAAAREGAATTVPNNAPDVTCTDQASCDFGPDTMLWQPGQAGQTFFGLAGAAAQPLNGPPTSLAAFNEGSARLTLETRYKGTPLTAYVVQMQVPSLVCQPGPGTQGVPLCGWVWSNTPYALHSEGGETGTGDPRAQPPPYFCKPNGGNNNVPPVTKTCTRLASNPLAGTVGLWEGDSFSGQVGDDGWRLLQYPINNAFQATAGGSLADYCQGVAQMDTTVSSGAGHGPLGPCAYARVTIFRNAHFEVAELPRPVRFVFTAASAAVDQGQAYWQIRGLALTEHRLALPGLNAFTVAMQDGEVRHVPVEIRNDALVDDLVQASIERIDTGRLGIPDVHVGLTLSSTELPVDGTPLPPLTVPPGQVRKVWAHIRVGYETNIQAGDIAQIPFFVKFQSLRDPAQVLKAHVEASFQALPRANLWAQSLLLSQNRHEGQGDASQPFAASEDSPVALTVQFTNIGLAPIGSAATPISVRATIREVDLSGAVLGTQVLPPVPYAQAVPGCIPSCEAASRFLTLYWTPPHRGIYIAGVELNKPGAGDAALQLPENDFSNNAVQRLVNVGAVPMPELQVTDAGLVPYVPGAKECDPDAPRVSRALVGHSYCVVATVANKGGVAALGTNVDFLASGSSFSSRQPFSGQGSLFPPLAAVPILSSVWDARLRTDGSQDWTFSVEVTSGSDSLTVLNKTLAFPVHVDLYKLALAGGTAPAAVLLAPDSTAYATFNVTNVGTAVASPVAALAGENHTGSLSVHLVQPPPLLPGETVAVRVAVQAGRSFQDGVRLPTVLLAVREDPLATLALPLALQVAGNVTARTTVLPASGAPGSIPVQAILDNSASTVATTWRLANASAPLGAPDTPAWTLQPFERRLVDLGLEVPATVPPGAYAATLGFRVAQGAILQAVEAPLALEVAARPGFAATLREPEVNADWSQPATVRLTLANTGNVPVEARLNASVDVGFVAPDAPGPWHLAPGQSVLVHLSVTGGQALRSLGTATVQWRAGDGAWTAIERPWQASFSPVALRIVRSDLDALRVHEGQNRVVATVRNAGNAPVQAEVLAIVDGVLHSREPVTLDAAEERQVALNFLAGKAGVPGHVEVIVRPVGSALSTLEPQFYQVGDMQGRNYVPSPPGPLAGLGIPAPPLPLLLVALACAVLLAAGRRRRA